MFRNALDAKAAAGLLGVLSMVLDVFKGTNPINRPGRRFIARATDMTLDGIPCQVQIVVVTDPKLFLPPEQVHQEIANAVHDISLSGN